MNNAFNTVRYAAFAATVLLAACSHRVPQATVLVIDTSLSITSRAEKAALDAVQDQISHMQRGDLLVLIPITGDAANDSGGRVLRLSAPTERESYDTDLRRFREQARQRIAAWSSSLDPHQSRTDILGALDGARQEFESQPKVSSRKLVVVSDFLEDDVTYHFDSDKQLTSPASARELAAHLREEHRFTLQGVTFCLGRLESSDFAHLSAQRKEAVQTFWNAYFAAGGESTEIKFDGSGLLADTERGCVGGKQ